MNMACYWICSKIMGLGTLVSTVLSWTAAVVFAYLTNRKWVFASEAISTAAICIECARFFACRIGTGILDVAFMYVFVDGLRLDGMWMKGISNLIVIVLNYAASRMIIFKKE